MVSGVLRCTTAGGAGGIAGGAAGGRGLKTPKALGAGWVGGLGWGWGLASPKLERLGSDHVTDAARWAGRMRLRTGADMAGALAVTRHAPLVGVPDCG